MTDDAVIRAMIDVERFRDALQVAPEVVEAYLRAEGYAWGYQDARGPDAVDTDQATAFARTYAITVAEFHLRSQSGHISPGQSVIRVYMCNPCATRTGALAHEDPRRQQRRISVGGQLAQPFCDLAITASNSV
ncbi:hypothetical protein ACWDSJ_09225 [Nocardia sp. NPDC003482]